MALKVVKRDCKPHLSCTKHTAFHVMLKDLEFILQAKGNFKQKFKKEYVIILGNALQFLLL